MNPTTFVLFGATGDLANRKIYPALYKLFIKGNLPEDFMLFGLGRTPWTDEIFRENVKQAISETLFSNSAKKSLSSFLELFFYQVLDIGKEEDYAAFLTRMERKERVRNKGANRLFYLSVGPQFFHSICSQINKGALGRTTGKKRLVIEKPFGHDLQSARQLNHQLSETFTKEEIYCIDHYLGKPMVHKLAELRAANPIVQALWNKQCIANVQISAIETVGVEDRAGYYDHIGALRDMVQNHMLQLLMMTASRASATLTPPEMADQKRQVMEHLVSLQQADLKAHIIRGQYQAGQISGQPILGYTSEEGISAESRNETFVAAKLEIENTDWHGVPFYIRTGKRMQEKATRIVIEFKQNDPDLSPNLLVFEISPKEMIFLQLNVKNKETNAYDPVRIELALPEKDHHTEAYENMILDALLGDSTYFAQWEEVEKSWEWVQPILDAFKEPSFPLHRYKAGSYGPKEAKELLAKDGFHWWLDDPQL